MKNLTSYLRKLDTTAFFTLVLLCLASISSGAVIRIQGHLKDFSGNPLQGNVYISAWPEHTSPPSAQVFSPPTVLGANGEFDISFDIGNKLAFAFHHYPVGNAPANENNLVRQWNNEFLLQLGDGGLMFVSRNGPQVIDLTGTDLHTFCGLDFKTKAYTEFSSITGILEKNDWDGTRGWCPDDYLKLNTTVSHSYPSGNLVRNGSFELNLPGCPSCNWEGWDLSHTSTLDVIPEDVIRRSGRQMASVRYEAVAGYLDAFRTEAIKVKQNTDYTLSFYYLVNDSANWDSEGARPMVRTYAEDGSTEVTDMISGRLGSESYFLYGTYHWRHYVHHFKTGPTAIFAKLSLIRAASVGASANFFFDDVQLMEGGDESMVPSSVTTTFSNPLGRSIQTRIDLSGDRSDYNGEEALFSNTQYDSLWRPVLTTLPAQKYMFADDYYSWPYVTNGYFPYMLRRPYPDVPAYLNEAYPEAGGFPYSETVYEKSPLGRTVKQSSPGAAWNIGSSHIKEQFYSTTSTLNPNDDRPIEAAPSSALYSYRLSIGEGGELSRTFTDKSGKVVRTSIKSETGWLNTDYEHDVSGNVSKIKPPPGPLGAIIETEFDYNSLGNKLSDKSPDAGQKLYIYDDANRLRFTQSQAQRDAIPARFSYVKYDIFNRPIESGEYLDGTKFSQGYANTNSFPIKDDVKVRISNLSFYDHLPPNRNYCLEGGLPSTITIRDDAPIGSTTEFQNWDAAYTFVRDRMLTVPSHPGTIQFYQVFNSITDLVAPPPGKQYPFFTLSDNTSTKGYILNGILKGGAQYQQLVSNYPFTVNDANLEGRIALTVSCNPELTATQLGIKPTSTAFNYDKFGNVTEEYEFNGYVRDPVRQWQKTSFRYDLGKRLTSKGTFSNVSSSNPQFLFKYSYDLANRLVNVTVSKDGGSPERVVSIGYNARGLPTYTYVGPADYQKNLLIENGYSIRGWMKSNSFQWIQDWSIVGKYSESMSYESGVNPMFNGNIGSISYTQAGENTKQVDYIYDALDRLKIASYLVQVGSSPQYSKEWRYNYHPNGAISSTIKDGLTFSYTYSKIGSLQTNRLGGVGYTGTYPRNTNNPNNFLYDANGRMTSDLSKGMILHYGGQEVPYQFDYPDGTEEGTQVMVYDRGARKSKFTFQNGQFVSATHYFSNGKEIREVNQAGVDVVKEIHPLSGYGRMVRQPNGNWDKEYFIRNHLGSTVAMVDVNGNVTYKTDYEPYGRIWGETQSQVGNEPLTEKFTGKEHDKGIDLDYFGARYYDADLGVWISPDPKREFASPYDYTGGNPVNRIDPNGEETSVYIWNPAGHGASSMGHVSVDINGTTYTQGHDRFGKLSTFDYLKMNSFRGASVLTLNLTPRQEMGLMLTLQDRLYDQKPYNALLNNCTDPLATGLDELGFNFGRPVLPALERTRLLSTPNLVNFEMNLPEAASPKPMYDLPDGFEG